MTKTNIALTTATAEDKAAFKGIVTGVVASLNVKRSISDFITMFPFVTVANRVKTETCLLDKMCEIDEVELSKSVAAFVKSFYGIDIENSDEGKAFLKTIFSYATDIRNIYFTVVRNGINIDGIKDAYCGDQAAKSVLKNWNACGLPETKNIGMAYSVIYKLIAHAIFGESLSTKVKVYNPFRPYMYMQEASKICKVMEANNISDKQVMNYKKFIIEAMVKLVSLEIYPLQYITMHNIIETIAILYAEAKFCDTRTDSDKVEKIIYHMGMVINETYKLK